MVFKGRFFSSKKSSESSSSPDGSSSPNTPTHDSPNRSDKKKVKSSPSSSSSPASSFRQSLQQLHQSTKNKTDLQSKDIKGKGSVSASTPPASPVTGPAKLRRGASAAAEGSPSPILASSLGLNRIKTRSGPLPQETPDNRMSGFGNSNLGPGQGSRGCSNSTSSSALSSAAGKSSGKKKDARYLQKVPESYASSWGDGGASGDSTGRNQMGGNSWNHSEGMKGPAEAESAYDACETPKESESPRFKAIMQATNAPRKKFPVDIKSYSHELNSKGVRPFPFRKPRGLYNSKEVLQVIQVKFEKAKEEVNSDLAVFAGDLVGIMEKDAESHPDWKETLEDLLLLARSCDVMTPGEFWLQCEGIVHDLDDRRQELPMGVLKKLHTHMLFILTRVQGKAGKGPAVTRSFTEAAASRKSYSQEQHNIKWKRSQELKPVNFFSQLDKETEKEEDSAANKELISSWIPLPSPGQKNLKEGSPMKDDFCNRKEDASQILNRRVNSAVDQIVINQPKLPGPGDSDIHASGVSKHQHKLSWGNWDQQISDEGSIMCRICEEYVPTLYVEDHSSVCAVADRCDQKGLSVDERLIRIAETLEKMIEVCAQKDIPNTAGSPDVTKISNSSIIED